MIDDNEQPNETEIGYILKELTRFISSTEKITFLNMKDVLKVIFWINERVEALENKQEPTEFSKQFDGYICWYSSDDQHYIRTEWTDYANYDPATKLIGESLGHPIGDDRAFEDLMNQMVDQIKTEGIKLKDANSCVLCHQMLFSHLFDCQINGEPRKICKQCIDKVEWSRRIINDQDIR
jgi:hypothetical protein